MLFQGREGCHHFSGAPLKLPVFTFEYVEKQRKLRYLDGLHIDVHSVNVTEKDPLPLGYRQLPILRA